MPSFVQVPNTTHQAAILGKVIDARTKRPVGGVRVTVETMPLSFQKWLAARALQYGAKWIALVERSDRTTTAQDGCFRLVDLPNGNYTVSLVAPGAAHHYGTMQQAFVVTRDANGLINAAVTVIELPPTGVTGTIKGMVQNQAKNLPLARIRVEDSGETTYANETGLFYLTGVELGTRKLRISASGFVPIIHTVSISQGTVTNIGIVTLAAAPP